MSNTLTDDVKEGQWEKVAATVACGSGGVTFSTLTRYISDKVHLYQENYGLDSKESREA